MRALENDRAVRWRLDQFRSLGFTDDEAWHLVASGAELHLTRLLIAAECPHHLAMRIVV